MSVCGTAQGVALPSRLHSHQLPLESLREFAAAAVGDLLIMPPRNGQTTMMLVTGVQASPIDLDHAAHHSAVLGRCSQHARARVVTGRLNVQR